jgi:hypothetical protein
MKYQVCHVLRTEKSKVCVQRRLKEYLCRGGEAQTHQIRQGVWGMSQGGQGKKG